MSSNLVAFARTHRYVLRALARKFDSQGGTMTTTTHPTRTIDGVDLPVPGTWLIDPGHTEVGFTGRHFGLTKIRGRFTGVDGAVVIGEDPAGSHVTAVIDLRTLTSGSEARDEHLRSADFFDVEHHPTATFRSTSLTIAGPTARLLGELTLKGVTRSLVLDVDYLGHAADPWGGERAVFSASGRINREDWGLTWNMLLDAGGLLVSKEITLTIEAELVRQTAE
jgi:polyisoprenoid-binding protein YceI